MQYKQLRFLEGKGCKRAPIVVTEFDFIHTWGKVFNHGSNLPAADPLSGQRYQGDLRRFSSWQPHRT